MREEHGRERDLSTADLVRATDRSGPADAEREVTERIVIRRSDAAQPADGGAPAGAGAEAESLFSRDEVDRFRARWTDIQAGFVDEPRQAVQQADALVAMAIREIAQSFAREREQLERQWDRGEDVSTEELRQALQRYRAFFSRLLSV